MCKTLKQVEINKYRFKEDTSKALKEMKIIIKLNMFRIAIHDAASLKKLKKKKAKPRKRH